jgi:flagellar hook-basal body complex protein FliE
MDPVSLSALKNYAAARQAIGGEAKQAAPQNAGQFAEAAAAEQAAAPQPLAKAAAEFSEVFANAESAATAMSVGQADPHSVVEALATAEVALETAVTVRDKVVEAYQELLRMPV